MTTAGSPDSEQAPWTTPAFIVLLLVAGSLSLWFYLLGHELTFFRDEWDMILYRLPTADSLLASHGGQQVPLTSAFFQAGSRIFGLDDYQYFRAATVPLLGFCAIVLFLISSPRIGPWLALLVSVLLMSLGASYEIALWPMVGITFAGAALSGMSALLLCMKRDIRYDLGAAALLIIAVAISGFGLVFLVGVATYLLLDRGSPLHRLWIPAPAILLYLIWYLAFQTVGSEPPPTLVGYLEFPLKMVEAGLQGMTGLPPVLSVSLGLLLVVAVLARLRQGSLINPLLISSLLMLATFLVLSTVARGGFNDPGAGRYIFPTVLLLLLIVVSLQPKTNSGRYLLGGVLIGLSLFSLPHGLVEYSRGAENLEDQARVLKAELAGAEVGGRETIAPETPLASTIYGFPTSYHYFDAVDRYSSSPALTLSELVDSSESQKAAADALLASAQGVVRQQPIARFQSFLSKPSSFCSRLRPRVPKVVALVPGETIWVSSSTLGNSIRLRRFGGVFPTDAFSLEASQYRIRSRKDHAQDVPWMLLITTNRGSVRICRDEAPR